MKDDKKHLSVSAIQNGTVIDHIPAQNLFKVISILGLDNISNQITFGSNFGSAKMGKKAIVKIADKYFERDEINRIAIVAPNAKLNIIKDYEVVEKMVVEVPDSIKGIVRCMNPKCITNVEGIDTRFDVVDKADVTLKCCYCEKITDSDHMEFL